MTKKVADRICKLLYLLRVIPVRSTARPLNGTGC